MGVGRPRGRRGTPGREHSGYAPPYPATVLSSFSGAITGSTRIHRILEEVGSIAFPGVFDTLSATLAHRAGFSMAFVSGYSVSATAIGEPDMGLLTQTELIDRARWICLSVRIPQAVRLRAPGTHSACPHFPPDHVGVPIFKKL
jgi:hypothetical protein